MYKIDKLSEILWWCSYSAEDESNYKLQRDVFGIFRVNKVYISKTHLTYKTEEYPLADGLYLQIDTLYRLVETFDKLTIKDIMEHD